MYPHFQTRGDSLLTGAVQVVAILSESLATFSNPLVFRKYNKTQTEPMRCLGFDICGDERIRTSGGLTPHFLSKEAR